MEKKELLASLNALTQRYEQHRHYIDKARAQAGTGKFNVAVIEKVILDHEIKSSDVADEVAPLLPTLVEMLAGLEADKARIEASRGGVDEQIQELELRSMIGELSEADFEREVADLRANQANANERIAAVDTDWLDLNVALERWANIAGPAGHYRPAAAPAPAPAVEPVAAPADPSAVDDGVVDSAPEVEEHGDLAENIGAYATRTEIREDLSAVFPTKINSEAASVRVTSVEEDIAIETSDVSEDVGDSPSTDVPFGFDDEIVSNEPVVVSSEVEIDLAGDLPADAAGDAEGASPAPGSTATPSADGEAPRRALLLYQEGTAEEQIYPFTGDILTIGRGRENDIQIKNDSKVSRYHCKLFRRGNNFYIEDQKSSNGSLVNGELITDRRLFGGEEIIIGETFFRFRIME